MQTIEQIGNAELLKRKKTLFLCSKRTPIEMYGQVFQFVSSRARYKTWTLDGGHLYTHPFHYTSWRCLERSWATAIQILCFAISIRIVSLLSVNGGNGWLRISKRTCFQLRTRRFSARRRLCTSAAWRRTRRGRRPLTPWWTCCLLTSWRHCTHSWRASSCVRVSNVTLLARICLFLVSLWHCEVKSGWFLLLCDAVS